jgi:hypothetical protein
MFFIDIVLKWNKIYQLKLTDLKHYLFFGWYVECWIVNEKI